MTVSPENNTYVKNHAKIVEIQDHLLKLAETYNKEMEQSPQPQEARNYIQIVDNMDIAASMTNMASIF